MKTDVCYPDILSEYLTIDEDSVKEIANSLCKLGYNKMFSFIIKLSQHLNFDAIFELVRSKRCVS